ncbi:MULTISPECIES: pimeloyl-ACP methyl ester esterase BioH [unclassified Vibrio]|uniref:Pimeloyl-[acyl-carrier protein] methyl ester esterase n=1 Tax=Vibrio sp. HB236076 TaxID=3232307 RepID=A0AB39HHR5_9VIBR|nr:pimeloyl-ACP methyl ester esterase BioH [Vibrio sp. HB161653]MDP5255230.1 pimeloyl-ACP methyl ester esterase BioH [Vibrio sp. HB161653]
MGQGPDLVLLHGWGMNAEVWSEIALPLSRHFRVHLVDLPGYGFSAGCPATDWQHLQSQLLAQAPDKAIWLGWSLGGLVVTQLALSVPERVSHAITVASSPRFSALKAQRWRGIEPEVLAQFSQQLQSDFQQTIERFMALQAMGSRTAKRDVKTIKQAVLSRPTPCPESLAQGLDWLAKIDLREQLVNIKLPFLRLYGRLDGLVPKITATHVDQLHPSSESIIFAQSSHAPFITEPEEFYNTIIKFVQKNS